MGPELSCGGKTTPNCTSQMLLFEVDGEGRTEPVTGDWITPLPDVLAKIPGAA